MVVLATKLYGAGERAARQSLESMISNAIGELEVTTEVGVRRDGFPSVTIDGDDVVVARNLLIDEWGSITDTFDAGQTYWGVLEGWDDEGFHLDAGAPITIQPEQLNLGVGSPTQLAKRFGLVRWIPMRFTYDDPPRLADEEVDRLFGWRRGPGRVTANAVTRSQLRATINRSGHAADVVTIERLGLLEQSAICTDDTDPPGLLAAIGPYLEGDLACVQ